MDYYECEIIREYKTLTEALKCLPGVAPNKSKELIKNAEYLGDNCYQVGETIFSEED